MRGNRDGTGCYVEIGGNPRIVGTPKCELITEFCQPSKSRKARRNQNLTKCVAVAHFGPPASYEMYLVLGNCCHLRIPVSYKLYVLVDVLGLHRVKDNRVNVLAASEYLREAALYVFIEIATFGRAVDK